MTSAAKPLALSTSDYVSAAEAIALLGVKPQTLYTYVSRGLIRSVNQPNRRQKLYGSSGIRVGRLRQAPSS
jgi:citrate synthase